MWKCRVISCIGSAGTFRKGIRESVLVRQDKSHRNGLYVNSLTKFRARPETLSIGSTRSRHRWLFRKSSGSSCKSQYDISIGRGCLSLKVLSSDVTGEGVANARLICDMFCHLNNTECGKVRGIWMLSVFFLYCISCSTAANSACWYNDNSDGTDHVILRPNAQIAILGSTTVAERRSPIRP